MPRAPSNLGEIREAVLTELSMQRQASQRQKDDVDKYINRTLRQMVHDVPFAFYESEFKIFTQPDAAPTVATDQVILHDPDNTPSAPENPWVFKVNIAPGTTDAVQWKADRTWDGRNIEIIDDDGASHYNRIRTVWYNSGEDRYYFSLVRPWDHQRYGTGPFDYRVFTQWYYFPDKFIKYHQGRILTDSGSYNIRVLGQKEATASWMEEDGSTNASSGTPTEIYRRPAFQIPGPAVAPATAVLLPAAQAWQGPEPAGKFQYVITYTWGVRDSDVATAGPQYWDGKDNSYTQTDSATMTTQEQFGLNRAREPLWESAPSPVTPTVETVSDGDNQAGAIQLTFPNIEYMQGFMLSGLTTGSTAFEREHARHSGWHVRVYRKRLTEDYTKYTALGTTDPGQHIPSLNKLDIRNEFYLLAEIRIDQVNQGIMLDNGQLIPDFSRPLRPVHGYQGFRFNPTPDSRFETIIRGVERPEDLDNDTDVPRVMPDAVDFIIHRAASDLAGELGDQAKVARQDRLAEEALRKIRSMYGTLTPQNQVNVRRAARPTRRRRVRRLWYKRG